MKRFVIVGTGGRGIEYMRALHHEFPEQAAIVGLCDVNPKRIEAASKLADVDVPAFADFDDMLRTTDPDGVIVTSVDSTHARYVVKALNCGCDVFSEKPLCTTIDHVRRIREAAASSTAAGYVTHNGRLSADAEAMKQCIRNGTIGKVLHITFSETLDRYHGADFFRRWHRFLENSGGLMIHKASHHFDLMNWLSESIPETVTAQGRLAFYGKNGPYNGKRCSECSHSSECDFHADVFDDKRLNALYAVPESVDHYFRDGCVFDPAIDIADTVSATISYKNGVMAGYSLTAYASYESMRISIEGTLGRLELFHRYGTSWAVGHKNRKESASLANDGEDEETSLQLLLFLPRDGKTTDITPTVLEGGHGGADPKLRQLLFGPPGMKDPLSQKASLEEGIQAVLVGLAVNQSMQNDGARISVQSI